MINSALDLHGDPFIVNTADGSDTLFHPLLAQSYHSLHGAFTESQHVFINNGLHFVSQMKRNIHILEIGFGTGLNAILSLRYSIENKMHLCYHSLDNYYLPLTMIEGLNFNLSESEKIDFAKLHQSEVNDETKMSEYFLFTKLQNDWLQFKTQKKYDLIYFDAFSPECQPNMWNLSSLERCYSLLASSGVLVTYCAKGQFKRDLKTVGFEVQTIPGPPGKREMTRVVKH
ncbi:MAG: tRNA (5-methylaminomethyl-2-thiouridine)(34)-methyltransferase MnmD [Saprospiraceae bacterium]|nr:tRNA (5-methylaminomethyl-2-thiouridine)(34)-methyltransferase MnmD [Saprospiraceae bacterium]